MKRLKAGVIGAGAISDIYLSNLLGRFSPQIELACVSSKGMRSAREKAARYGIAACPVSDMLADPSVELVIVLTPVGSHAGLIRAALEAGKIAPERYRSYERLYEIAKSIPEWEKK